MNRGFLYGRGLLTGYEAMEALNKPHFREQYWARAAPYPGSPPDPAGHVHPAEADREAWDYEYWSAAGRGAPHHDGDGPQRMIFVQVPIRRGG